MNIAYIESLLEVLPAEVVRHYEKNNALNLPTEIKAYKFSKRLEWLGYPVLALCVAGLAFATSHFDDSFLGAASGAIVCAVVIVLVISGAQRIASQSGERVKRLSEFEVAVSYARIPHLHTTPLGVIATRQLAEENIVSSAKTVIEAERHFKEVRTGYNYSVIQVVHAGQAVLEAQARFERVLQGAVEFGLSDGDKRPFFSAAEKQLNQTATSSTKV